MVRYDFPSLDAEGYFAGFDRAVGLLAETHGGDRARAATLGSALASVLAVWLLQREHRSAAWAGDRLTRFYDHVRDVIAEHGGDFVVYLGELDFALADGTDTGWYNACFTRSVVEVLRKGVGLPQKALLASDWEEATDEELRDAVTRLTPLPADVIPRGMPAELWWWFAASWTCSATRGVRRPGRALTRPPRRDPRRPVEEPTEDRDARVARGPVADRRADAR